MATITAESILDRAATIIQDETNARWPLDELLRWLNDGQREIVLLKPDAYTQNTSKKMTSGTKQSLPSDGLVLIDVPRNLGSDGETPGKVVRVIDRRILDDQLPEWHKTGSATSEIDHYAFDARDPKHFYVWPPSDGTGYIELIYSSSPGDVLTRSDIITLDDIYSNALLDYILYRAYLKDADYTANNNRAMAARGSFMQSLGRQDLAEMIYNPNISQQNRQGNMMTSPGGGGR